jgi:hypothetical protein
MRFLFLLLALFSFTANADFIGQNVTSSNTYVVSKTNPVGSDSNNCSASKPCLTVAHTCGVVSAAGSIIHVNAGTYLETAQCVLAAGVTLEGVGVTSIIKANAALNPMIKMSSVSQGTFGNQEIRYLKLDGNSLTGTSALRISARSYVKVHDVTVNDWSNSGLYFQGIDLATSVLEPTIYAKGNELYNVTLTNSASYSSGAGVWIGGQDGLIIRNNNLSSTGRTAGTNGFVIKQINDGFIKNAKIYDNVIFFGDTTLAQRFSVELWDVNCLEMWNNTVQGSVDVDMVSVGSCSYGAYIHNNTFSYAAYTAGSNGLAFESGGKGIIVDANKFVNLEFAIAIHDNAVENFFADISITNNLFIGIARAVYSTSMSNKTLLSNLNFEHNTLVGDATNSVDGLSSMGANNFNIKVRNNIFKGFIRAAIFDYKLKYGLPFNTNWTIENNIFYGNGNSNLPYWNGDAAPVEPINYIYQNNLITDPLLVSDTDLHLQVSSPAIGAGLNVGVSRDYEGFQHNRPDIGAIEYNHY